MHSKYLWLALTALFFSTASMADSHRCPNGSFILTGDTTLEVQAKCGAPDAKEYVGQVEIKGKIVNVDRYLYTPGRGKFHKIIEFQDGVVVNIINGPRVK